MPSYYVYGDVMTDNIFLLSVAATTLVKVAVDIVRLAFVVPPRWMSPLLAVIIGPIVAMLLVLESGVLMSDQTVARCFLAGLLAAGGAVGVTELARKAT